LAALELKKTTDAENARVESERQVAEEAERLAKEDKNRITAE